MLQNNLSFKMTTVREAVVIIGNENKVGWKLNDAHFADWVTTITARLRNMMFVIGREMRKKQPVEWVHKLFDGAFFLMHHQAQAHPPAILREGRQRSPPHQLSTKRTLTCRPTMCTNTVSPRM